jgi:hypothetical protein
MLIYRRSKKDTALDALPQLDAIPRCPAGGPAVLAELSLRTWSGRGVIYAGDATIMGTGCVEL